MYNDISLFYGVFHSSPVPFSRSMGQSLRVRQKWELADSPFYPPCWKAAHSLRTTRESSWSIPIWIQSGYSSNMYPVVGPFRWVVFFCGEGCTANGRYWIRIVWTCRKEAEKERSFFLRNKSLDNLFLLILYPFLLGMSILVIICMIWAVGFLASTPVSNFVSTTLAEVEIVYSWPANSIYTIAVSSEIGIPNLVSLCSHTRVNILPDTLLKSRHSSQPRKPSGQYSRV